MSPRLLPVMTVSRASFDFHKTLTALRSQVSCSVECLPVWVVPCLITMALGLWALGGNHGAKVLLIPSRQGVCGIHVMSLAMLTRHVVKVLLARRPHCRVTALSSHTLILGPVRKSSPLSRGGGFKIHLLERGYQYVIHGILPKANLSLLPTYLFTQSFISIQTHRF